MAQYVSWSAVRRDDDGRLNIVTIISCNLQTKNFVHLQKYMTIKHKCNINTIILFSIEWFQPGASRAEKKKIELLSTSAICISNLLPWTGQRIIIIIIFIWQFVKLNYTNTLGMDAVLQLVFFPVMPEGSHSYYLCLWYHKVRVALWYIQITINNVASWQQTLRLSHYIVQCEKQNGPRSAILDLLKL